MHVANMYVVLYDFKTKFAYDEAIELLKNVTRFSQEPKIGDLKKAGTMQKL